MKHYAVLLSLALLPALAHAGDPDIVQMSPDTYMIAKQSKAGIFGNSAKMKTNVIRQANAFAESQGKVAVPLSSSEVPMAVGQFASFEYRFRLVAKSNGPTTIDNAPQGYNSVADSSGLAPVNSGQSRDLYDALLKLDDLRKRGILTQAEFDAEKHKLLATP